MNARLLSACLLFIAGTVAAQPPDWQFQDGRIWFRVTRAARVEKAAGADPRRLPVTTLPFLVPVAAKFSVTNLAQPFFAAKSSDALRRTYRLEFSDRENVAAIIDALRSALEIEYAERVPLDRPALEPNDPLYRSQWAMKLIRAPIAWNIYSTGSTTKIAIVDDAISRTHEDLSPNLWINGGEIARNEVDDDGNGYVDDINGYDVASNDNDPNPPDSAYDHGTPVAGSASAATNNKTGVASIGFSCKLIAVKATNRPGVITHGYDGVVYASRRAPT
jgi:subtilisin family serine protease